MLVETKDGPCWAKNQSVALVSGVPSAVQKREVGGVLWSGVGGKHCAELPENVSSAGAIVVVNFDEPILVTAGDDYVAVVLGIDDGIGVGPIGVRIGSTVDVKMVELIPSPGGLRDVIGIIASDVFHIAEVNNHVSVDSRPPTRPGW